MAEITSFNQDILKEEVIFVEETLEETKVEEVIEEPKAEEVIEEPKVVKEFIDNPLYNENNKKKSKGWLVVLLVIIFTALGFAFGWYIMKYL